MNKKLPLFFISMMFSINSFAFDTKSQNLLNGNLKNFIAQVVEPKDQNDFAVFFENFRHNQEKKKLNISQKNEKHRKKESEKLRKRITNIQEQGKTSVEVRNPVLAQNLKKCTDSTQKIHMLFYRYGVYEEFLKNKANKQKSVLAKTKSYMRDAGNKITAWFGKLRKPKTATT